VTADTFHKPTWVVGRVSDGVVTVEAVFLYLHLAVAHAARVGAAEVYQGPNALPTCVEMLEVWYPPRGRVPRIGERLAVVARGVDRHAIAPTEEG
jgi:hypothetical protein